MATAEQFGALIPERELAIAAWKYGLHDATRAELVRVCILMLIPGMTVDEAKRRVLARRNPVTLSEQALKLNVRIPTEDLLMVREVIPDLSNSQLLRYAVVRSTEDHDKALELSVMQRGRPRKPA